MSRNANVASCLELSSPSVSPYRLFGPVSLAVRSDDEIVKDVEKTKDERRK